MKISGQFQSEETAKYYAIIKSYIETSTGMGLMKLRHLSGYVKATHTPCRRFSKIVGASHLLL